MYIKTEKMNRKSMDFNGSERASTRMLPGEIRGLETNFTVLKKGGILAFTAEDRKIRILFIINGSGTITAGKLLFTVNEMAAFWAPLKIRFIIQALEKGLEYLEILYEVSDEDIKVLSTKTVTSENFITYSKCGTYREAIKSDRTINRTIISGDSIPRFCMGSVETAGPDVIGAHEHPMLEQLFFGLPGNYCLIRADEEEVLFDEYTLLHIPTGSMHSARVVKGHTLHYLWMDFFKSSDMSYISKSHYSE